MEAMACGMQEIMTLLSQADNVSCEELAKLRRLQEYIVEDMLYKANEVLYESYNKYALGLRHIIVDNQSPVWIVVYPILFRMRSALDK